MKTVLHTGYAALGAGVHKIGVQLIEIIFLQQMGMPGLFVIAVDPFHKRSPFGVVDNLTKLSEFA